MSGTVQGSTGAAWRVAVVGAGWSGLAAAVRATEAGHAVTLVEMAAHPGGRARSLPADDAMRPGAGTDGGAGPGHGSGSGRPPDSDGGSSALDLPADNGQHILIGAYTRTLALMRSVGVAPDAVLWRAPLTLRYPDGRGLTLPAGHPLPAFVRGVASARGWTWADKFALLWQAQGWALRGFRCAPGLTVAQLCHRLPPAVRSLLIDPLCVAALNTPAHEASAAVLLRVLRDALFGGRGAADLLLPRQPLDVLLPAPAVAWLQARGAVLRFGTRVRAVERRSGPGEGRWTIDGEAFDAVVLACTAAEAARLAQPHAAAWAAQAVALRYEPIITVLLRWPGARLHAPMTALLDGLDAPAQYAFDHGALGATPGRFAFVVSGARAWVDAGLPATGEAVLRQSRPAFAVAGGGAGPQVERVLAEKRATFRCTPGLQRPQGLVAPGLWAAGDYIAGPYPATLEGAVRAGEAAAAALPGSA